MPMLCLVKEILLSVRHHQVIIEPFDSKMVLANSLWHMFINEFSHDFSCWIRILVPHLKAVLLKILYIPNFWNFRVDHGLRRLRGGRSKAVYSFLAMHGI